MRTMLNPHFCYPNHTLTINPPLPNAPLAPHALRAPLAPLNPPPAGLWEGRKTPFEILKAQLEDDGSEAMAAHPPAFLRSRTLR